MNERDQLIEIAALDGWLEVKEYTFNYDYMGESGEYKQVRGFNPEDLGNLRCLRDYLNSRDVIVPLRVRLISTEQLKQKWIDAASIVLMRRIRAAYIMAYDFTSLTAGEESEVVLRVFGKWIDK